MRSVSCVYIISVNIKRVGFWLGTHRCPIVVLFGMFIAIPTLSIQYGHGSGTSTRYTSKPASYVSY